MNDDRLRALIAGQTNIARKVLAACPLREFWTPSKIANEMRRMIHTAPTAEILEGALESLRENGLVRVAKGAWQRCHPEPPPADLAARSTPMEINEIPPRVPASVGAFTRMASIAERMRGLIAEYEECALELQGQVEAAKAELATYSQLKTLLKAIKE